MTLDLEGASAGIVLPTSTTASQGDSVPGLVSRFYVDESTVQEIGPSPDIARCSHLAIEVRANATVRGLVMPEIGMPECYALHVLNTGDKTLSFEHDAPPGTLDLSVRFWNPQQLTLEPGGRLTALYDVGGAIDSTDPSDYLPRWWLFPYAGDGAAAAPPNNVYLYESGGTNVDLVPVPSVDQITHVLLDGGSIRSLQAPNPKRKAVIRLKNISASNAYVIKSAGITERQISVLWSAVPQGGQVAIAPGAEYLLYYSPQSDGGNGLWIMMRNS